MHDNHKDISFSKTLKPDLKQQFYNLMLVVRKIIDRNTKI